MAGTPDPAVSARADLGSALRELAFAVNALQLYPPDSPVVSGAVGRAHGALFALLGNEPLTLGILPQSLRVGSEDVKTDSRTVRTLAERLHQCGVSHLRLDNSLNAASLQRLAELLAMSREALEEGGGISGHLERERLPGIALELLRLERLYEEEEEDKAAETDAVWENLLQGFGETAELDDVDWDDLASDPQRLQGFLEWLLNDAVEMDELSEFSRVQLVRTVCKHVGEAAAAIGQEKLEQVVEVVGRFYDELDNEVWIELLTEPLTVGEAIDPLATAGLGPDGDFVGTADETVRSEQEKVARVATAELGGTDLAERLAHALQPNQVEDLILYGLKTRQDGSPRIYQLFERVLEKRSDRDALAQAIREAVERQVNKEGSNHRFADIWPQLSEALRGETPDPYVSLSYRIGLDQALLGDVPASLWPLERIQPRMRELDSVYLLQRKGKVLLAVLEEEKDDDEYRAMAQELEKTIPELIINGQYIATEEILTGFVHHLDPTDGRSIEQRQAARDILLRFCNQHTLREVVRNLANKPRTQIDAATRIFRSLGPLAIPALLEALSQENSRPIRLHLARMLAAMGDQSLPEIKKHLRDQRWFFVRNLVWIIGEIGEPRFVRHVALTADHPDARVRKEAVRALAKLGDRKAADVLMAALEDEDHEIQLLAVRGLGHAGSREAVSCLCELLRLPNLSGQNTEMLRTAAIALGRIGDQRALRPLRRLARAPLLFRSRRMKAVEASRWAIGSIRGEESGEAPEDTDFVVDDDPRDGTAPEAEKLAAADTAAA